MPDFDLYVIGDAAYTYEVMSAIASIFGTGSLSRFAAVGFLVGVIFAMCRGIMTAGRQVDIATVFLGLLIYLGMFTSTATVHIHSVTSGNIRTVANVPFGPAAIGSILSRLGYTVTDLFEHGFTTPGMTNHGYVSPIQTAALLKKSVANGYMVELLENNNEYLVRTYRNYIKECTLIGVKKGLVDVASIKRSSTPLDEIKFTSTIFRTKQYSASGAESLPNCSDGFVALKSRVLTAWSSSGPNILKPVLLKTMQEQDSGSSISAQSRLSEVASLMTGSGLSAQKLALNMFLKELTMSGELAYFNEHSDANMVAAMEQMRAQRNATWMLEQDNWGSVMLPLITFFENFVFAISPFMVFIVFLGASAIKLLGKYMFLTLWVQLWMPLLAIVNLFVMMSATGSMDMVSIGGPSVGSFEQLTYIGNEVNTWLAVSGKLMASIPAISFMLLYGTSQAATQISRGLEAGGEASHAAKNIAPDTMSTGAAQSIGPMMQGGMVSGTGLTNNQSRDFNTSQMGGWSQQESSSSKEMAQAKEEFGKTLGATWAQNTQGGRRASAGGGYGESHQWGMSKTDQMAHSMAKDIAKDNGIGVASTEFKSLESAVAGSIAKAFGDGEGGSANLSLSGSDKESNRNESKWSKVIQEKLNESDRYGNTLEDRLLDQATGDYREGNETFLARGASEEQKEALSKADSALRSEQDEYAAVASMSKGGSVTANRRGQEVAEQMTQKGMGGELKKALDESGISDQQVNQLAKHAESFEGGMGLSGEQAKMWAGMSLLLGHSDNGLGQDAASDARESGAQLINQAYGTDYSTGANARQNVGVGGNQDPEAKLQSMEQSVGEGVSNNTRAGVEHGINDAASTTPDINSDPRAAQERAKAQVAAFEQKNEGYVADDAEQQIVGEHYQEQLDKSDEKAKNDSEMSALDREGAYQALKDTASGLRTGGLRSNLEEGANSYDPENGLSDSAQLLADEMGSKGAAAVFMENHSADHALPGDENKTAVALNMDKPGRRADEAQAERAIGLGNEFMERSGAELSDAQQYAIYSGAFAQTAGRMNETASEAEGALGEIMAAEYAGAGGENIDAYLHANGELLKDVAKPGDKTHEDGSIGNTLNLNESVNRLNGG